ncbi:SMP-30/Gluconolaconase/LRE-like region-domain-containing protein [Armillaria nabsnona]|nr:SMP-30/Gluconolaconase/LRE-like region-domain-containing protein [Armillaria nabsnona]
MSFLRLAARPATLSRPFLSVYYSQRQLPARWYSAAAGLTKEAIENRVLSVFKGFEKVKAEQLGPSASFKNLGLDSLDAVEVVMAVEEEFSIEIPDEAADEMETIEQVIKYISETPEGPIYDPRNGVLHFVDIQEKKVYHLNTQDNQLAVDQYEDSITCLALCSTGLACAASQGFALLDGPTLNYFCKPIPADQQAHTRFNDGACDSKGRFFAGTVYSEGHGVPGMLYRYDPTDRSVKVVDEGPFTDSNGLGWSLDEKTFYFTDTERNIIYAYDYDDGNLSNRRVFIDANKLNLPGFCDGLCIDEEGCIWSARWEGSRVVRFTREGNIDFELFFPTVWRVTACCFGGPNNDQLYVTTAHCRANGDVNDLQEKYPDSGHLFVVDFGGKYRGSPRHDFGGR